MIYKHRLNLGAIRKYRWSVAGRARAEDEAFVYSIYYDPARTGTAREYFPCNCILQVTFDRGAHGPRTKCLVVTAADQKFDDLTVCFQFKSQIAQTGSLAINHELADFALRVETESPENKFLRDPTDEFRPKLLTNAGKYRAFHGRHRRRSHAHDFR